MSNRFLGQALCNNQNRQVSATDQTQEQIDAQKKRFFLGGGTIEQAPEGVAILKEAPFEDQLTKASTDYEDQTT